MGRSGLARLAVLLVFTAAVVAPSGAGAATLPEGDYTAQFTGGSLDMGSLLAPVALPPTDAVQITIPAGTPASVTLSGISVTVPSVTGSEEIAPLTTAYYTLTAVVTGFSAAIDPSTGAAGAQVSFYATLSGYITVLGFDIPFSCAIANVGTPVTINLSTANPGGSPWNPDTGDIALADNTFAIPTPTCNDATVQAGLSTILGSLDSGNNALTLNGRITRLPAPVLDTTPVVTPMDQPAAQCVVPKLKGKKVRNAKRALRKAGCGVKVKKKHASRRKRGKVLRQKPARGTLLPEGSKVTIVVGSR
jgi:PASTA domain